MISIFLSVSNCFEKISQFLVFGRGRNKNPTLFLTNTHPRSHNVKRSFLSRWCVAISLNIPLRKTVVVNNQWFNKHKAQKNVKTKEIETTIPRPPLQSPSSTPWEWRTMLVWCKKGDPYAHRIVTLQRRNA